MINKVSLKIGLLFFVLIVIIESILFLTLYVTLVNEQVDEVMENLLARGNTHSEVVENSYDRATLEHVGMMESASDFIVVITDASGDIIVNSDSVEPEMIQLIEHTDYDAVPAEGEILANQWNEDRYIATDSPIVMSGEHRGHVFMFADANHVKRTVKHLRNQFAVTGLATVILTIISILILSRFIARPLIKMKEATKQLSRGESRVDGLDMERKDELGELARSISELSTDLDRLKNERNEFLASISHELRTPLTYIKGYADIVSRPDISIEERKEYIAIIREETDQLTALIQDLFELARMDENQFVIKRKTVVLEELIHSITELTRPVFAEKNIQLSASCESGIVAFIDPERFQQVLLNILDNAKKHSAAGTRVTLKAAQNEHQIVMTVRDEGEGIPAKDQLYIFDRLYRVEKSRSRQSGGTGLGLAIAKEIVESHGGSIEVSSQVEKGTTIIIKLKRGDQHL